MMSEHLDTLDLHVTLLECPDDPELEAWLDEMTTNAEAQDRGRLNWNNRAARMFACDCAERVVHLCGDDPRPRRAIETARRYVSGEATGAELAAASAAAWATAWAGASAAAWATAWAGASATVWTAASAAARAAATFAASAASAAERAWQLSRLLEYVHSDG
jgi:hypothetical protein